MQVRRVIYVLLVAATLWCGAAAEEVVVTQDEHWSNDVVIDEALTIKQASVTVAPGARVRLSPGAGITVGHGGSLVAAGTEDKPIRLTGGEGATIHLAGGALRMERCLFADLRLKERDGKASVAIFGAAGSQGVRLVHCRFDRCGTIRLSLNGPFEMRACDLRESDGLAVHGQGRVTVENNTLQGGGIGASRGGDVTIRGNVIVEGGISVFHCRDVSIVENYARKSSTGSNVLVFAEGDIRDNVLRGGTWVSGKIGGTIVGNVFLSLPQKEHASHDEFDKHCTHEHICGLKHGSRVERNILVGPSYGAIMGIGESTVSNAIIRHNTFDMHGHGNPLYLNHLVKSDPSSIEIYNNIFMRCGGIKDEAGIKDSARFIDHNLWADAGTEKWGRFLQVTMADKSPGDPGFGGRDTPRFADRTTPLPSADVVQNPDVTFPFSDEALLSRATAVTSILTAYRGAYTPKQQSAAVNTGTVREPADPIVTDGHPDIGAVERQAGASPGISHSNSEP